MKDITAPSRVTIEQMIVERIELYWRVPLSGRIILVILTNFLVNESIPE